MPIFVLQTPKSAQMQFGPGPNNCYILRKEVDAKMTSDTPNNNAVGRFFSRFFGPLFRMGIRLPGWTDFRLRGISRRITTEGIDMKEVATLYGAEPREILRTLIEKKVPAIMSYLSKGKWHVAKVLLCDLGACRLNLSLIPGENPHPVNIRPGQPVGLSIKHGYGKFIFEAKVLMLEPSCDAASGGNIVVDLPGRIEVVQRRSYFRVEVPKSLKVNVLLWHRRQQNINAAADSELEYKEEQWANPAQYCQGRLVDISAGGAQIALPIEQKDEFKLGQFIGMRFTPMPYDMPMVLNAQIRNVLPTVDGSHICLGLQLVGLEASHEGREVLSRLIGVTERYHQMNQSGIKQHDFQRNCAAMD